MMLRCLLVVFVCLVGWTAQATPSQQDAREQAKAHYLAGKLLKEKGDYDGAISEYRTAYDLAPNPELLFNLGLVYRLSGKPQQALDSFEKYLAASPDGRGSAKARAFVQELKSGLAESPPETTTPVPLAASTTPPAVAPSSAKPSRPRSRWIAPGVTLAGVGVAITGGALLGSVAVFANSHRTCIGMGNCASSATQSQQSTAYAGYALTAIGGAAAAAGLIGWIVTWRHRGPPHAWLIPSGNEVAVGGVF